MTTSNVNREAHIWNAITEHYNECASLSNEIFGVFLQGSQNYKLDCYTDDYSSDIDTKAILLPSFSDVVSNKSGISTTHIRNNNEHIDLKDIRLMFETFKKQNINFIEILFSDYYIANPAYEDLVELLRSHADELSSAHFNQSLRCMAGMSMEKLKALCHPYPSIADKIEKYGYDPKQLYTLCRLNYFIKDFVSGKSYRDCLVASEEVRKKLIEIKTIPMALEDAVNLAQVTDNETHQIEKNNLRVPEIVDSKAYNILEEVKIKALTRYFKEVLK